MDSYDKLSQLYEKRQQISLGGGEERIARQHEKGKLTARERIDYLLDQDTFVELNTHMRSRGSDDDPSPCEGVVTGYGKIDGRKVYLYAQDFTVNGGSLGEVHAQKICAVMDLAAKTGVPIVGLNDSGGARIQEGVSALDGYGKVFYRNAIYSGVIPQISVIMGPCAGGAVYSPALTDFVIMVEQTSQMFVTGPKVLKAITGEEISAEDLGGAAVHNKVSGSAHLKAPSEKEALDQVKVLIDYFPQNNRETPVESKSQGEKKDPAMIASIVPENPTRPYDVRNVIKEVVDNDTFFEIHPSFAKCIVVGFARMNGKVIGLVCNQPKCMAGGLDIDASDKASRFIRFCDAFNIPLVTLEDVTGFFPGVKQEHGGIIRHGAKLLYAFSEATVPKITVILRKAYGGAYVAMNSKAIGADLVFVWPNAEIAVMGPEGAASVIYAKEIQQSDDPETTKQKKIEEYRSRFATPYHAAGLGMVDDVITPEETRSSIIQALDMLEGKSEARPFKKHGNIPL
ncbi:acyl-CoA carboxylase subunit beta [Halobacillus yeomjeoni]|uniref:Acyl-CoA carboxylase subunit beta n=1 Tax=Halobacillus yeomjeoni TaxID=311194 RepID=A0A931MUJ1_9BACI|nr:acyl-CoA carboxylase subunit beta [Halobacillus yeomjeoni]MBH0229797.1 acyl-CoA carboxylase subunit beta [Halobacillus yeomjeoni]